jgi:acetate kinase
MSDAIFVLNAGSSSIKFALFETTDRGDPRLSCKSLLDEDQNYPRLIVKDGHVLLQRHRFRRRHRLGGSRGKALAAISHRVVHGAGKSHNFGPDVAGSH